MFHLLFNKYFPLFFGRGGSRVRCGCFSMHLGTRCGCFSIFKSKDAWSIVLQSVYRTFRNHGALAVTTCLLACWRFACWLTCMHACMLACVLVLLACLLVVFRPPPASNTKFGAQKNRADSVFLRLFAVSISFFCLLLACCLSVYFCRRYGKPQSIKTPHSDHHDASFFFGDV